MMVGEMGKGVECHEPFISKSYVQDMHLIFFDMYVSGYTLGMRTTLSLRAVSLLLSAAALSSCGIAQSIDFSSRQKSQESSSSASQSSAPSSQTSAEPVHKEVLFIGNSFAYYNDVDQITQSIGRDLGLDISCSAITEGGKHLIDTASSSDPLGQKLDAALTKKYTHIVLQEHSTTPVTQYGNFLSGVKKILEKINATQDQPEVYLYATWSYSSFAASREMTIPESELLLRNAYLECAKATNTLVSHVGKTFTYVYETHPTINLYHTDDKHPSFAGSYLSACVHAANMFGLDVRNTTFLGSGAEHGNGTNVRQLVDEATAVTLRKVAYETVHGLI